MEEDFSSVFCGVQKEHDQNLFVKQGDVITFKGETYLFLYIHQKGNHHYYVIGANLPQNNFLSEEMVFEKEVSIGEFLTQTSVDSHFDLKSISNFESFFGLVKEKLVTPSKKQAVFNVPLNNEEWTGVLTTVYNADEVLNLKNLVDVMQKASNTYDKEADRYKKESSKKKKEKKRTRTQMLEDIEVRVEKVVKEQLDDVIEEKFQSFKKVLLEDIRKVVIESEHSAQSNIQASSSNTSNDNLATMINVLLTMMSQSNQQASRDCVCNDLSSIVKKFFPSK